MKSTPRPRIREAGIAIAAAFLLGSNALAQTPMGSAPPPTPVSDTAIIFEPSQPLIKSSEEVGRDYPYSWGFDASFSDYGFGGGLFLSRTLGQDFTASLSFDLGTAKGSHEFDLVQQDKINDIYVIPLMASVEYRLFRNGLSENLRPFAAVGVGPVVAMSSPSTTDFFPNFGQAQAKIIPGGFLGLGAKFGTDPKSNFGASIRYFIIPYPGSIQSTATQSLTNLSGLFITVSYGYNF